MMKSFTHHHRISTCRARIVSQSILIVTFHTTEQSKKKELSDKGTCKLKIENMATFQCEFTMEIYKLSEEIFDHLCLPTHLPIFLPTYDHMNNPWGII